MKIKIEDLHLLAFYYLIMAEADINIEDEFMKDFDPNGILKPIRELIIGFVEETEKILN